MHHDSHLCIAMPLARDDGADSARKRARISAGNLYPNGSRRGE
jgi:hypothetical protein